MARPSETAAVVAVTQLQAHYGDAVTRQAWAELPPLFVEGCPIRLDLGGDRGTMELDGATGLVAMLEQSMARFDFFLFTILLSVVDVAEDGRSASGRLTIGEIRRSTADLRWEQTYGLYRDRYVEVDGGWRIAARHYTSLARPSADGTGVDVFPVPGTSEG